jgi:hypothetical protein
MIVELIDDFFAENPAAAGSDKVDTSEADEVIDAIAKTVAELTSQQDRVIRQQVIEQLMQQIMHYAGEFRQEEATSAVASHANFSSARLYTRHFRPTTNPGRAGAICRWLTGSAPNRLGTYPLNPTSIPNSENADFRALFGPIATPSACDTKSVAPKSHMFSLSPPCLFLKQVFEFRPCV